MANPQLLDLKLKESGKTKTFLSNKIGISRPRLDNILKSPDTATVGQADILCKELCISANDKREIFLA